MGTVITICARGGSVGVPRKNLRPLKGKPLIVWTIEQALAVPGVSGVFFSTDDQEIAAVAASAGATVLGLRPAELATSAAPKLPVISHLLSLIEGAGHRVDRIVDLDPTSPLRSVEDIQACISLLTNDWDLVITGYLAEKNPYFNMVERRPDESVGLSKPPSSPVFGRQSAPQVFAMNGSVYAWHRESFSHNLWQGRVRLFEMPRERSIDIDSEIDFKLVELLLDQRAGR